MRAVLFWIALSLATANASAYADSFMPDLSALVSSPGSTVPPPVNSTGAVGVSNQFARADHTHVSSVWKGISQTDASGNATFNFTAGFFSAAPVISAEIENTAQGTLYTRTITTRTSTQVIVNVQRVTLSLGILNFSAAAAGINVHLFAAKSSN